MQQTGQCTGVLLDHGDMQDFAHELPELKLLILINTLHCSTFISHKANDAFNA